ncbi:hypothetical protein B0A78_06405 [Flavobacterium columnare NBRC 100251 = ATCC 23463]|uniref:Type VI secretion system baseplate subunit TssK n=2 Tax=Flavobacterium columnare TaxID=996 RepID=G8XBH5_FLACA|nr:hypothetical protein [Flavobacterium columnare]AEW86755.1 hypothetical protein FCOL_09730 [Flavobacterium columnare ATCC 49512]AMO20636.1 hypothetical protein UN65_10085 [Flavobacterium columnare]ANO47166.1 hypothetical protein Pf1_01709 [Flavobacterium columnare]APT22155.1 hypothetical protein BU993_05600 [Flavobacterium columnare]AUX18607.1 hypothetical protein AQ623_10235 [Flavobacterium columnare]
MIEKLNYFPVNWIDGMKINKNHFNSIQNFINDSIKDAVGLHTSLISYGLLPSNNPIKLNLMVDSHKSLRVQVQECHAITPNGSRIEIDDRSETVNTNSTYLEASYEIKGDESLKLWVCISVNYFKRIPFGDSDPEENPPRYPFTKPEYLLSLIPENELVNETGLGGNFLIIGKVLVNSYESKIDNAYIPPSVYVGSHKRLQELYDEINRFYGQIEIFSIQIAQKINSKKQANELALMMLLVTDKILDYLGVEINKIRWLGIHKAPSEMLLSVIGLARTLKNLFDSKSGAGKEELLNYFADWCNVNQGTFENIFLELINNNYNHNQIDISVSKIHKFMDVFENLLSSLSRLDYIGKKRDGSIFVSEITDERDSLLYGKRSKSFLAD